MDICFKRHFVHGFNKNKPISIVMFVPVDYHMNMRILTDDVKKKNLQTSIIPCGNINKSFDKISRNFGSVINRLLRN